MATTKRLLDATSRELATYTRDQKLAAIRGNEGRTLASEMIATAAPLVHDVSNPELAASQGADLLVLNVFDVDAPAVAGLPGAQVRDWVAAAHRAGALTMTAVGTSQEGADVDTIRRIALMAKMTGTDVHHLGDCGYYGITLPENLVAYSIAIRGRRHTYRRMAMSIAR